MTAYTPTEAIALVRAASTVFVYTQALGGTGRYLRVFKNSVIPALRECDTSVFITVDTETNSVYIEEIWT